MDMSTLERNFKVEMNAKISVLTLNNVNQFKDQNIMLKMLFDTICGRKFLFNNLE